MAPTPPEVTVTSSVFPAQVPAQATSKTDRFKAQQYKPVGNPGKLSRETIGCKFEFDVHQILIEMGKDRNAYLRQAVRNQMAVDGLLPGLLPDQEKQPQSLNQANPPKTMKTTTRVYHCA